MTKEERKKRSAKQMECRQNKTSKESEGEMLKRLKREADCQKKQGDIKFDNYCKRMRVPCPPPRQNEDTGTTTRAHRKICRDAIKDREEKKIRKEQKRRSKRMKGAEISLPRNAVGPGVHDGGWWNEACGGDAAAAMNSLIKDDIKNGKSTTYCYDSNGVRGSWKPKISYARCQGFVSRKGQVGRCSYQSAGESYCLCPLCTAAKEKEEELHHSLRSKSEHIVRHSISAEADTRRHEQLKLQKQCGLCGFRQN